MLLIPRVIQTLNVAHDFHPLVNCPFLAYHCAYVQAEQLSNKRLLLLKKHRDQSENQRSGAASQ